MKKENELLEKLKKAYENVLKRQERNLKKPKGNISTKLKNDNINKNRTYKGKELKPLYTYDRKIQALYKYLQDYDKKLNAIKRKRLKNLELANEVKTLIKKYDAKITYKNVEGFRKEIKEEAKKRIANRKKAKKEFGVGYESIGTHSINDFSPRVDIINKNCEDLYSLQLKPLEQGTRWGYIDEDNEEIWYQKDIDNMFGNCIENLKTKIKELKQEPPTSEIQQQIRKLEERKTKLEEKESEINNL